MRMAVQEGNQVELTYLPCGGRQANATYDLPACCSGVSTNPISQAAKSQITGSLVREQ